MYTKQSWANYLAGGTAIDDVSLAHIEDGIYDAHVIAEAAATPGEVTAAIEAVITETGATDGQVATWNATAGKYLPATPAAGGGGGSIDADIFIRINAWTAGSGGGGTYETYTPASFQIFDNNIAGSASLITPQAGYFEVAAGVWLIRHHIGISFPTAASPTDVMVQYNCYTKGGSLEQYTVPHPTLAGGGWNGIAAGRKGIRDERTWGPIWFAADGKTVSPLLQWPGSALSPTGASGSGVPEFSIYMTRIG